MLLLALVIGPLGAQVAPMIARADPVACPDAAPHDTEVVRRLAWIESVVERDEDDTRRWYGSFIVVHILLGGVNVALAFAADSGGTNIDSGAWWRSSAFPFAVNATGGTLGLLTLLIAPPAILGAGDFLRSLPRATPEERLGSLREAERRLSRDHDTASFVRGPLASLASTVYVAAASMTLLFLDHVAPALIQAIGGSILAQGRLLLHPAGPIDAWRTYRAHHPDAGCQSLEQSLGQASSGYDAVRFALEPSGLGLTFGIVF